MRRLLFAVVAAAGAAALPCGARADCELALSQGHVDFGQRFVRSLPAADRSGYRVMGVASAVLTGSCTEAQKRIRIAIDSVAASGEGLIRWASRQNAQAAVRMTVVQASVGAEPVPVVLSAQPDVAVRGPLDLSRDSVIELDMSGLAGNANRRVFTLALRVSGLVPEGYAGGTEAIFSVTPVFSLLP